MRLESYASPEMALLLASTGGDASRATVRRLMAGPINWPQLTRLAVESHATPGLWEVVSKFPNLPSESEALQTVAVLNDFRRLHIRSLTARVVRDLAAAGIEVLTLKGAALLVGGVAHPTPRTMGDIDMLVIRGSPEKAWELCRTRGWALLDEAMTEELYSSHHHLPPLRDPDGVNVGLELHRALMTGLDRVGFDVASVIRRSRIVEVNGVGVRVPAPEDLLLHLCLHFVWSDKVSRGAWRTFADAHAITTDPLFSWTRFVEYASTAPMRKCSYWTLRLGRALAELRVPNEVLAQLDPEDGGQFGGILERHFATQIGRTSPDVVVADRVQRWLWLKAVGLHAREARELWSGSVEFPPTPAAGNRLQRSALVAGIRTSGYFVRLLARG